MSSGHEIDIVDLVELSGDFRAKEPSSPSWRDRPSIDVLRVRPHQVTEWPFMWNFHTTIDQADLIKGLDIGRETSVDTKDFSFNNCTNAKIIENFAAILPWVYVAILAQRFFVEAIHRRHTSSLVISSQESDAIWVPELEA